MRRRSCLKVSFLSLVRRTMRGESLMLLLGIPQEVAKKGTKGTPLGTPPPDGFLRAAGAFAFASLLHLGRISARPRWVRFDKNLFAFSACRSWCLKSRHSINSLYLTSRLFLCRAAKQGRSKRERLGAFSWFVLCRAAKNEHPAGTAHARSCVRVWEKQLFEISTI